MSRKDYEKIGKLVKDISWKREVWHEEELGKKDGKVIPFISKNALVNGLADIFEADSPKFDRGRFFDFVAD